MNVNEILEELKEDKKYKSEKKEAKFVFKSKFAGLAFNILVVFAILILVSYIILPTLTIADFVNYWYAVVLPAFILLGIGYVIKDKNLGSVYVVLFLLIEEIQNPLAILAGGFFSTYFIDLPS